MKPIAWFAFVLAALVLMQPRSAAQTAKFRQLLSIYADEKGVGLNHPEGVACRANGDIVVADTGNGRLVRFTFRDRAASGGRELQVPQLPAPTQVRFDSSGRVFALDSRNRQIVQLSTAGEFVSTVSFSGAPPPGTTIPKSFDIDQADALYVLDVFSARVLIVSPKGAMDRVLPLPPNVGFATAVTVDDTGTIFVLDSTGRRLFTAGKQDKAFSQLGRDLTEAVATLPTLLTVSKGTIFIGEGRGGRLVSLRRDGSFVARQLSAGREEGALDQPAQMCINANDEAFIADRDNSRIQVFQLIR